MRYLWSHLHIAVLSWVAIAAINEKFIVCHILCNVCLKMLVIFFTQKILNTNSEDLKKSLWICIICVILCYIEKNIQKKGRKVFEIQTEVYMFWELREFCAYFVCLFSKMKRLKYRINWNYFQGSFMKTAIWGFSVV